MRYKTWYGFYDHVGSALCIVGDFPEVIDNYRRSVTELRQVADDLQEFLDDGFQIDPGYLGDYKHDIYLFTDDPEVAREHGLL